MRTEKKREWLPALVLAAATAVAAGCAETEIQGVILDEDMRTPTVLLGMARGVNSEFTDLYGDEGAWIQYYISGVTDDLAFDGVAASEVRLAVGDFHTRPMGSLWSQAMEASWVGIYMLNRMREIIPDQFDSSPLVARTYLNVGLSERILGENFCELVYNFGPDGGFELPGDTEYDRSRTVPRDSAFKRALPMLQEALAHAEAAADAGVATPEDDPLFDPAFLVTAAHAGLAQVYADLGAWDQAVEHAQQVPDDFEFYEHQHEDASQNNIYTETYFNDDLNVWGTPAATYDDPRAPFSRCAEFTDGYGSGIVQNTGECTEDDQYVSESESLPYWRQEKYQSYGADVMVASGAEMRLIEAEAALQPGSTDLATFTATIDRVRALYGLAPIAPPTQAGELEFPNEAYTGSGNDDAWSILDRERYLTLWLEARRLWDMDRWDHPYLDGHAVVPWQREDVAARRDSCFPVPEAECTQNGELSCEVLSPPTG